MGLSSTKRHDGWLIEELYAMRQTGRITDLAAGWILQCVYGEHGIQQLAQLAQQPPPRPASIND